jgi:UDP-glucose 4-epimerase
VASTIGVYDGPGDSPLREDLPLPMTAVHPIPAAKKIHELLADFIANATGLEIYLTRIGGAWGPLGRPASRFITAPQMVHAAVQGRPLDQPVYAADGGDLVYVRDCGRAIALLQLADRLSHRTYNVSGGRVTTNAELAAAIGEVIPGTRPALRDGRSTGWLGRDIYLDISRLREDTGFRPGYDTAAAVADYIGWLRSGNER